jgi:hypothetical protein
MVTKSELMSILVSFLLVLGLDNAFDFRSYFSSSGRFTYIFGYFEQLTHPNFSYMIATPPATAEQATISIAIPLLVAAVALTAAFTYFTRKMEVD